MPDQITRPVRSDTDTTLTHRDPNQTPSTRSDDTQNECENCGDDQSLQTFWTVKPSSPAARQLDLDHEPTDGRYLVCKSCYAPTIDDFNDS